MTVTKHFEKVVYIYNKSAFEQRENCILKAKKGSINFFLKNYISTKMCSAKWEMTSLKSTDVLERISCSIANMTLEQILLCIFFLFQTGNYFFFVKFLFSIFLGLWYNNVNFCYRCSMILLYSKYIQRANQKCSSYFDLLHVCCKL